MSVRLLNLVQPEPEPTPVVEDRSLILSNARYRFMFPMTDDPQQGDTVCVVDKLDEYAPTNASVREFRYLDNGGWWMEVEFEPENIADLVLTVLLGNRCMEYTG